MRKCPSLIFLFILCQLPIPSMSLHNRCETQFCNRETKQGLNKAGYSGGPPCNRMRLGLPTSPVVLSYSFSEAYILFPVPTGSHFPNRRVLCRLVDVVIAPLISGLHLSPAKIARLIVQLNQNLSPPPVAHGYQTVHGSTLATRLARQTKTGHCFLAL